MIKYISDTHFGHENIIKYCQRPFAGVEEMDARMLDEIQKVDRDGDSLYHGGDWAFHERELLARVPSLLNAAKHRLVVGNHDRGVKGPGGLRRYHQWFGKIFGSRGLWRENHVIVQDDLPGRKQVKILLSHRPQEDLLGCAFNVYGHVHNNLTTLQGEEWRDRLTRQDPDRWAAGLPTHLNACVEIVDYTPRTLAKLIELNR